MLRITEKQQSFWVSKGNNTGRVNGIPDFCQFPTGSQWAYNNTVMNKKKKYMKQQEKKKQEPINEKKKTK